MRQISVPNVLDEHHKKMTRLLASDKIEIINIQMRAGEFIPPHNAKEPSFVIVRRGELFFNVEGIYHCIKSSDILAIEPLENFSLEAITDIEVIVMKVQ